MTKEYKAGDKVSWKGRGGEAHGKVVREQTSRTRIIGHEVAASTTIRSSSSKRMKASGLPTRPRR